MRRIDADHPAEAAKNSSIRSSSSPTGVQSKSIRAAALNAATDSACFSAESVSRACAAQERETLSAERQERSVAGFKSAARMDFDWTPVGELLERMDEFFAASAGWPASIRRTLAYQAEKVYSPERRYARMEACHV